MLANAVLLEREHETARLAAALDGAAAGAGSVLLVEGEPGIGKTSLLEATAALARERGFEVLRARGGELEQALAFGIARDLLARRVASAPEALRSAEGPTSVALPALGLGPADAAPVDEAAINHGLTWLVSDLAVPSPLLLLVDDVQWADAASAGWLLHLARRVGDLPAVLLLGARQPATDEPPSVRALRELREVERIRPAPLGAEAVGALVRDFFAPDAEPRFVAACHRASGGNPFHAHALLDAAAAHDIAGDAAGAARLAAIGPEATRHAVAAALRRAGPDCEALASVCAILGEAAEVRHAAVLAGLMPRAAELAADRLSEESILVADRPLRFRHPILRASVEDTIPRGRRAELHRAAADLFETEGDRRRAAAHLLEVAPTGDADVAATLMAAADEVAGEGAMAHAAQLYERALAEPAPESARVELLARLGRARLFSRTAGGAAALIAAADAIPDAATKGQLYASAAWASMFEAPERLRDLGERVLALPREGGDGRLRAVAALAIIPRWTGVPTTIETREMVAEAAALSGATSAEREFLGAAALAAAMEHALDAAGVRDLARRALGDPANTLAPAAICALQAASAAGGAAEALEAVGPALAASEQRGNLNGVTGMYTGRAIANWWLGRLAEAEADAVRVWDMVRDQAAQSSVRANALLFVMLVYASRGRIDDARELGREEGRYEGDPGSYGDAFLSAGLGIVAIENGDLREGIPALLVIERLLAERGAASAPWMPHHRVVAVDALMRLGEEAQARELAEKELALARSFGADGPLGYALRAMGLVEGGAKGRALLEEGASLLERAGERDRLARTLFDLGRMLRLAGKPSEARTPLRRALELAEACGAELVAQRAFDELRAAGAKPRRRALSGPESLTPSEARIARLAADGQTNRKIAQALFLSSRTVESHLGRIYAKLGVAGRADLAAALTAGESRPA